MCVTVNETEIQFQSLFLCFTHKRSPETDTPTVK